MSHALAKQRFDSYEDVKKLLDDWFTVKGEDLYWRTIHKLHEKWEKCIRSDGAFFEKKNTFYHSSQFNVFLKKNSAFPTCIPSSHIFHWSVKNLTGDKSRSFSSPKLIICSHNAYKTLVNLYHNHISEVPSLKTSWMTTYIEVLTWSLTKCQYVCLNPHQT